MLISSSGSGTQAFLTVNAYLSFVVLMLVVFGAAFELPLLVVMANLAGGTARQAAEEVPAHRDLPDLRVRGRRATPTTDPFTMCAMAIPMVLLYEGAVVYAIGHDRRKAKRKAAERAEEPLDDLTPSTVDAIPRALPSAMDSWSDTT